MKFLNLLDVRINLSQTNSNTTEIHSNHSNPSTKFTKNFVSESATKQTLFNLKCMPIKFTAYKGKKSEVAEK